MKITKRQLKRIIKEEKTRLLKEQKIGTFGGNDPAERAIGLFFDTAMMDQFISLVDGMYHNAMEAGIEETGEPEEAYRMVVAGLRRLLENEIEDMRY
jgi:hypothetical protein